MTTQTTKLDLAQICPELAKIEWVDTDADKTNQQHCPLCFEIKDSGHADDCEYPTIAATMLKLAEQRDTAIDMLDGAALKHFREKMKAARQGGRGVDGHNTPTG